jgi:hypothetical protein
MRSILLAIALLFATMAHAEEAKSPPASPIAEVPAFMSLFDGKTLDGWIVTECEAVVKDGTILLASGNGFVRSQQQYADFILELDWKALAADNWDSGVFFRAGLPVAPRPWPKQYQANFRKGQECNVDGLKGATSTGLTKPGEWNHFKLTVVGPAAEMEINGRPAWKATGLKPRSGYIGLQAEVPLGGQFLFRNIRIAELGYKPLFNGRDLSGWEGGDAKAETCWKAEDGLLTCTGKPGTWLRTTGRYGDFNLRLEYKLKPGGNSGVYIHSPANGEHHGQGNGVEVQILDDASPRYAKLEPYQYSGSLYTLVPAKRGSALPAGQWNRLEINCRGTRYRVVQNGAVVIDVKADTIPDLKARAAEGFLGLQNHNEEVSFRNLRVGPAMP